MSEEEQESIELFLNDFDLITDSLYSYFRTSVADNYCKCLKIIKEKLEKEWYE